MILYIYTSLYPQNIFLGLFYLKMPFSLKDMRWGCASQASTAICTTTPHRLSSYLTDQTKSLASNSSAVAAACRNSFSFNFKKRPSLDAPVDSARRHSSAEVTDYLRRRRKSSGDMIRDLPRQSTAGSSRRHLLSDTASFMEEDVHLLERKDTDLLALEIGNVEEGIDHRSTSSSGIGNGRSGFNQLGIVKSSSRPPAPSRPQIVVLRVSLHCRGCEAKLRKHISKMEGVTSFDIDFEMKKVSVTGNVTPLYVLNSITKVKNAQFWPSPTPSTSSPSSSSSGSSTSEFSY